MEKRWKTTKRIDCSNLLKIDRVFRFQYAHAASSISARRDRHHRLRNLSKSFLVNFRRRGTSGSSPSASRRSAPKPSSSISGRTGPPSDSRISASDPQSKTLPSWRGHGVRSLVVYSPTRQTSRESVLFESTPRPNGAT